jgi:hypothetical protein
VHSNNFTLRDLTNFLTSSIDTLEDHLLKVSNIKGLHITRPSHRSSLSSACDCTHYVGLNRRELALGAEGGVQIGVHGTRYEDPEVVTQGHYFNSKL